MIIKLCAVGLLAVVGHWLYRSSVFMGYHVSIQKHHPGPCKVIPNINHGSEDVTEIPGDKLLITTGLRYLHRTHEAYSDVITGVYLFDFNHPERVPTEVALSGYRDLKDCDFHGISSWVDKDTGEVTVFIVNHPDTGSVVEIFAFDDAINTLLYQETIGNGDPNFRLLNDVTAIGPRQFYVTNFLYTKTTFEIKFHLKWGFVTFFDGHESRIANEGRFLMSNGIVASANGRYIYMADFFEKELVIFNRNDDDTLQITERVQLYTSPDNIIVDPATGDLWVGCHPVIHDLFKYSENPSHLSPSQVLRIKLKDGRVTDITEVMMDDGKLISGSSVAVYRKNQLFVGTVASNAILCDVKYV